jgi:hypothetical protein
MALRWEGEAGRGDGAAGARMHADVVSDLADSPQSVAMVAGPGDAAAGSGGRFPAGTRSWGGRLAGVSDLAVQRAVICPDQQLPMTGAVADGVDREFMGCKDNVPGTGLGNTGVDGVSGHCRPQRIQRPGIEILGQDRGDARVRPV